MKTSKINIGIEKDMENECLFCLGISNGDVIRGSETVPKILKLGRPLVTAEVIPDNLIMMNSDK